jgi:hypothetical protein
VKVGFGVKAKLGDQRILRRRNRGRAMGIVSTRVHHGVQLRAGRRFAKVLDIDLIAVAIGSRRIEEHEPRDNARF